MRQIALDTETTGLSTDHGHRIIEIGCIEIIDRKITSNHFHCYLNPEREIDAGALAVHGITNEFLDDKPRFKEVVDQLIPYLDGAELIIHNAPFDVGFLNSEFSMVGESKRLTDYCKIFDTLMFARARHPGQKNSLDALCKRYDIDNSHRQLHGALLDSDLLARLYLAMTGGQGNLFSDGDNNSKPEQTEVIAQLVRNKPLPIMNVSEEEHRAHRAFVDLLTKSSGVNLWDEENIS